MIEVIAASATVLAALAHIVVPSVNKLRAPPPVIPPPDPPSCVKRLETPPRHLSGSEDTETLRPLQVPLLLYGPLLYVPGNERITYTPAQSGILHRPGMSPARIEPPAGHSAPPKAPPLPTAPLLPTVPPTPFEAAPHPRELPGLAKWTGLVDVMAIMPRPTVLVQKTTATASHALITVPAIKGVHAVHTSTRQEGNVTVHEALPARSVDGHVECPICHINFKEYRGTNPRQAFYNHLRDVHHAEVPETASTRAATAAK